MTAAHRVGDGPVEPGTAFDLVTRFGGREVPLRYAVAEHEPPRRIVLEAQGKGFTSRDTITVARRRRARRSRTTRCSPSRAHGGC